MGKGDKKKGGGSKKQQQRSKAASNDDELSNDNNHNNHNTTTNPWLYRSLAFLPFMAAIALNYYQTVASQNSSNNDGTTTTATSRNKKNDYHTPYNALVEEANFDLPCRFVLAPSTLPNGGYGVFSLTDLSPSEPVFPGDPIIQVPDLTQKHYDGISFLLHSYIWLSSFTGGNNEGNVVYSTIPGLQMLANHFPEKASVQFIPPVYHHNGVTRRRNNNQQYHHPTVGSSTHYRNTMAFTSTYVNAGDEIFLDYGSGWTDKVQNNVAWKTRRNVKELVEEGICLDHFKPGISSSSKGNKGRGAFAVRSLSNGTIVAPVPFVPIHRSSLKGMDSSSGGGGQRNDQQLLLNYCFGHSQSSVLLFPYAPLVTLINHASSSPSQDDQDQDQDQPTPNVKLRWSDKMQNPNEWFDSSMTAHNVVAAKKSGLLMELVAIRDIAQGDEILLDYGPEWELAWNQHVQQFTQEQKHQSQQQYRDDSNNYQYSFEFNQTETVIRTVPEQQQSSPSYPANLMTACYYNYAYASQQQNNNHNNNNNNQWIYPKSKFKDPASLHPCLILSRSSSSTTVKDTTTLYTAQILNRNDKVDPLPNNHHVVVTDIPRHAITFIDRMYTTDQHLPYAFRHEIGIPEELFPKQWRDLQ